MKQDRGYINCVVQTTKKRRISIYFFSFFLLISLLFTSCSNKLESLLEFEKIEDKWKESDKYKTKEGFENLMSNLNTSFGKPLLVGDENLRYRGSSKTLVNVRGGTGDEEGVWGMNKKDLDLILSGNVYTNYLLYDYVDGYSKDEYLKLKPIERKELPVYYENMIYKGEDTYRGLKKFDYEYFERVEDKVLIHDSKMFTKEMNLTFNWYNRLGGIEEDSKFKHLFIIDRESYGRWRSEYYPYFYSFSYYEKTYKWELDSFKYKETNSDTIYSPESIFIPSVTLTVHQRLKEERLKQLIKQDLLWDKNNLNKYDEFTDDINYWEGTENYQYGDITLEYTTKTDSQPNITLCDCINDKFSMSNIEIKYCEDIFMSTYGVRNPFFSSQSSLWKYYRQFNRDIKDCQPDSW